MDDLARLARFEVSEGGGEAWAGAEATAGVAKQAEADWALLPRELLEQVLCLLPPPAALLSAALVCRGWAVVAAPELGRRRSKGARAGWAAASRALPVFSGALAEAEEDEVRRLADEESAPPPVVQLFFALDLLCRRHERRKEWPVERPSDRVYDPAALDAEDRALRGSDLAPAEWDLEDPAWRQGRWEAARQVLRSPPDFQRASLCKALPLGPAAMARLRRRMGMTTAGLGGGWEPGPRLPLLVPGEVAAHSPVAGRLAEWLMGAQELMRAGYETEAAKDWAWPAAFVRSVGGRPDGGSAARATGPPGMGRRGIATGRRSFHQGCTVASVAEAIRRSAAIAGMRPRWRVTAGMALLTLEQVVDSAALKLAALGLPALPPLPPHDAALGEALAAVEGVQAALAAAVAAVAAAGVAGDEGLPEEAGLAWELQGATRCVGRMRFLVGQEVAAGQAAEQVMRALLDRW